MKRNNTAEIGAQNWPIALVAKAVVACMAFAFACVLSTPLAYADDLDTSFMVAAAQQDGTYVLEPTSVPYRDGDTVLAALERADVGIGFTQTGMIDSIAGVKPTAGAYLYYFTDYDSCESKMLGDVAADSITALFISSADVDGIAQGHVDLLDCMRTYLVRTDGLRNYPDAKSAYERAHDSLPGATNAQASVIAADFAQAIQTYDAYMASPKNAVTFSVTRAGAAVNNAQVAMVDLYGNRTQAEHTGSGNYVANVVPGVYAYQAMSADGLNGVRGATLTVSSTMQIQIALPEEEWFKKVTLRVTSDDPDADCPTEGTSAANRATQIVRNVVPDTALSEADVAVWAEPSTAINSNASAYPLYTVYTGVDGEAHEEQIAYRSKTYKPPYLLEPGVAGTEYTYEVRHNTGSLPLEYQVEICRASIERSATLSGLSVREGTAELISEFSPYTKTYDVYTSSNELEFAPDPHGSAEEGYAVQVDGQAASSSNSVTIAISDSARDTPQNVRVVVRLNSRSTTYIVKVHKTDAANVTVTHDPGIDIEVLNSANTAVQPSASPSATESVYKLLEGHTYTYVATTDTYFHATNSFTAHDGYIVQAATPVAEDAIESFSLGRDNLWGSTPSSKPLFEQASGSTLHEQRFLVPDGWSSQTWLRAYAANPAAAASYAFSTVHTRQATGVSITSSSSSFKPTWVTESGQSVLRISGGLQGFTTASGYSNKVTFTVNTGIDPATGAVLTQDYFITANRVLTLPGLSVSDGDNTLKMLQSDTADSGSPVYGFDRDVRDYTIAVAEDTASLQVRFTFPRPISSSALAQGGYTVVIDGKETAYEMGATKTQEVSLDPEQHEQVIPVIVRHDDPSTPDASYRLKVQLMPKVPVQFDVTPAEAVVTVTDPVTGLRINAASDGTFNLISGYEYSYTVAARGYVGQQGTFIAHDGLETTITLAAAPVNPAIDTGLKSHWPYFRADSDNNGVVDARTPIPGTDKEDDEGAAGSSGAVAGQAAASGAGLTAAVPDTSAQSTESEVSDEPLLYWATQLGEGYDSGAAGCPILVDGFLYTYAGDKIYRVDTVTGEIVKSGTMVGTSSFAITPMTYAEGMVFVALSNGRVEAFNAVTLESLWVYTSPNGGQPNSPITYHDGCIYTGFWNWSNVCDFVCLSVTDEDPATPGSAVVDDPAHPGRTKSTVLDAKVPLWTMQHEGGFYWAGAWAGDDYLIVGSDNAGISAGLDVDQEGDATGPLFSIDPVTGRVIDTLTSYQGATNIGNIRSTVMRDASTGLFYFCGRGGYLCEVAVNSDGTFDKSRARAIRLQNDASDGAISSTSTPVVYNGRAYVGADHGSYNAYDGQCVDVVDLATGSVAYTVQMQGRAQTSGLLTTGYLDDDGYVYIYYFDNYSPGKLRCFKDKPGQTKAVDVSSETYGQGGNAKTYDNMANVVFCPKGAQAQFCICSPIADEYGTIYFKNDSAYTMALGSPITKLEVTEQPTVTQYGVGEAFEPAGMKVVATYANGATRDVSDYVKVTDEPFESEGIVDVPVVFPYTMYQSGPDTQDIGEAPDYNFDKPMTTVSVAVGSEVAPRMTTTELPRAYAPNPVTSVGEPYEVTLSATGAPRDFTWTCEGNLPAGLEFVVNAGDGTASITGEPAAGAGGAYPLKVTCANSAGSAEADFTLEVYEIPTVTGTNSVLHAVTGQDFSYQVQASGYPLPLVYGLQEGFVSAAGWTSHTPAGLSIDESTGLISGKPLEPIDYTQYRTRVYASNAAGVSVPTNLRISVTGDSMIFPGAPEITTDVLGHALAESETGFVVVGEQVDIPIEVTGDPEPEVTVAGLPEGLSYDADAGKIVGAATVANEASATVTVTANNGQGEPYVRTYSLFVYEEPVTSVDAWAGALFNEPYEQQLGVTGTPKPQVIVTGLPSGLRYDVENGKVFGTPKMKGTFKVSITATNSAGSFTKTYQLVVGAAPGIGVYSLPEAHEGEAYTAPLNVSGEPEPEVTIEGLPEGLRYDETNGVIAGTTNVTGTHQVRVRASNGVGEDAVKVFPLVVREHFEMLSGDLPFAIAGQDYEETITFGKPLSSAVVNGLPSGITYEVNAEAGTIVLRGLSSVVYEAGCSITISATSTGGTQLSVTLTLVVEPAEKPVVMGGSVDLFPWTKGQANSVDLAAELQATGRPAEFTWMRVAGSLPKGVTLSDAGVLSGTPEVAGSYSFQVTCANGVGSPAQATVKLLVSGSPDFTALVLPQGEVGKVYSGSVATDQAYPAPTYRWYAVSGSTLPPGLTLDTNTGIISGTCTQRGIFDVIVSAENEGGLTSEQVSVVVKQQLADAQVNSVPSMEYTGAPLKPSVTVRNTDLGESGGSGDALQAGDVPATLIEGVDYTVDYANNVNVGTATVTVTGAGLFVGSVVREFAITKAAQPLSVSVKTAKVQYKKVKQKNQKLAVGKALVIGGAQGKVTCKLTKIAVKKKLLKQAKKKIKLAVNGTLTLKKKLKKGTYKLTVQVSADGNANYKPGSKTVVVKVVVK